MLKVYKYRLYQNKEQQSFLNQNFGAVRFVWNKLVANFNSYSTQGPNQPMSEKILKDMQEYSWLNDVISYALQQKRIDFIETKNQYFSKNRKIKIKKIKFKSKGNYDSFRIPATKLPKNSISLDKGSIKLPKMSLMKMIVDKKFTGTPRNVTISRNPSGQYFVSILVEELIELKQNTNRVVGIDLGLKDLVITSNGTKFTNPKWFRENQSKLKVAQKHLSRKVKGSNRYNKQRVKVAKIYQKISNQRNWYLHNISSWLVSNYDIIVTENLKVSNMVKNKKLSKSISDASWSKLVEQLKYKSTWYGKTFYKIDTYYPSSKTCSCCGHVADILPLNIRNWVCSECNTNHDRDLNASINILNKGLDDLYQLKSDELTDYKCREEISPLVLPKAHLMKRLVSFIEI